MMDVGRPAAVRSVPDGGVVHELVLQIQHRLRASDKEDCVSVVQCAHLVWCQKFTAAHLKIGGVGAGPALGLPMGFRINGGFAKGLGNVFVRR